MPDPNNVLDISDAEAARQAREFIDPRNKLGKAAQRVEQGIANPQDLVDTAIREIKTQQRPEVGVEGNPSVEGQARIDALNQISSLSKTLSRAKTAADIDSINSQIQALAIKLGYQGQDKINQFMLNFTSKAKDVTQITENVLNKYILPQYHYSLTMLPVETATSIHEQMAKSQGDIGTSGTNANLSSELPRDDRSVTIASTGENQRNFVNLSSTTTETVNTQSFGAVDNPQTYDLTQKLSFDTADWNYYNIESMTVENVLSPSANNPAIAEMLTMKMRILEPSGMKLVEDLRLIANNLGYQYVPNTRVLYRVDIWFSGFDSNSGEWIGTIPFQTDYSNRSLDMISYYVNIATVDAKLDGKGAVYEVGFVPSGHQAWRPEDVVFDSMTVTNKAGDENFGSFLDTLSKAMHDARANNTKDKIQRDYVFYAPDVVRAAAFNKTNFFNKKNLLGPGGGTSISKARNIDVIKLIEEAWADCVKLQDWYLRDGQDNNGFLQPRVMLTIEFNTKYGRNIAGGSSPPVDNRINDYAVITHQYKLVPYVSFKKGLPTEDTIKDYVDPKNQVSRIKEMIKYGMVQRVYNYINTGANTEVLNLELAFRNFFYFEPLWPSTSTSPNSMGIGNSGTAGALEQANRNNPSDQIILSGLQDNSVDRVLKQVFGNVNVSAAAPQQGSPFQRTGPGATSFNTLPFPDLLQSAISEGPDQRSAKYLYYQADHLQRDMLTIEMDIKGDPIWLMSSYGNSSLTSLEGFTVKDVVIVPKTDRVIFLRLYAPIQKDYMSPTKDPSSSYPMIIGGFYQVLTVTSTFSGGKFTQRLKCSKYHHLNYIEQYTEKGYGKLFSIAPGTNSPNPATGTVQTVTANGTTTNTNSSTNLPTRITPITTRPLTTADIHQVRDYVDGTGGVKTSDLTYEQRILATQMILTKAGYTADQVAAVTGNMMAESTMRTSANAPKDARDGTNSFGLMQWNQDRLRNLNSYVSSKNLDMSDLKTQVGFAIYEGSQPGGNNWTKALGPPGQPSGSLAQMTSNFDQYIEVSDGSKRSSRISNAQAAKNIYVNAQSVP